MEKRTKNTLALMCIAMVCVADDHVVGPYCVHMNVTSQTTETDVKIIPDVVEMEG